MAQAMFMSAQVLGSLLGSALSGYLAEHHGYDPMLYEWALAAVGLVLFVWQQRGRREAMAERMTFHP